ncbi:hypothetical protein ACOJCY_003754, partial [Cronobacter dublinensis]
MRFAYPPYNYNIDGERGVAGALRLPALQHNDGERSEWRVRFAYPPYNNDGECGEWRVRFAYPPYNIDGERGEWRVRFAYPPYNIMTVSAVYGG